MQNKTKKTQGGVIQNIFQFTAPCTNQQTRILCNK